MKQKTKMLAWHYNKSHDYFLVKEALSIGMPTIPPVKVVLASFSIGGNRPQKGKSPAQVLRAC